MYNSTRIHGARLFLPTVALATSFLMTIGGVAHGQLPVTRLGAIFPPGANPGQTLEVTISGEDLDDCAALRFSHPGISAKQKMAEPGPFDKGPIPVQNQFVLTLAANVPPGVYDVRAIGKYGISNPRAFTVGDLPEVVETEPNESRETATELALPCVLNGQAERATDVDWYQISPNAGQRILIDCKSRRIDSMMDPVVSVFDAAGRELDSSRDHQAGDPLIDFTVPATGQYFIQVHDALYRGNDGKLFYFYRLAVGMLTRIDFAFPPAAVTGSNGPFTLYGRNLPGGQPAGLSVNGKPLQKLSVGIPVPATPPAMVSFNARIDPETAGIDGIEYRLKGSQNLSNPLLIGVATAPVVLETEPNSSPETAQKIPIPSEIAGQFYPQRDDDWFSFEVKAGESYAIEVISQRLGVEADPSLLLQEVTIDAEGKTVVRDIATVDDFAIPDAGAAFDVRSDDPSYLFVATADATCRILLRDANGGFQSDPRAIYRFSVRKPQPDFRLAAAPATQSGGLFLRKGGSEAIQVVAWRRDGFDGEIVVTVSGLPAGVTASPLVLGPTQTAGLLVLTAADTAAPNVGFVQVAGKAKVAAADVVRTAQPGTLIWPMAVRQNVQQPLVSGESRLCNDIAVSVSEGEVAPVLVTAGQDQVWETSRGGILKIPFQIVRRNDFKGNLAIIARDLPANIPAPLVNANAATGEYELKLTSTTPTGTYTFFLDVFAQNVSYARNPEAAKSAADRKVEIDKFNTDAIAAAKVALTAKQAADKVVADAAAAMKVAETAKLNADKIVENAEAALKAATEKAIQAKAAAKDKSDDANLAAAAVTAEKVVTEATATRKAAQDAATVAQKKLEETVVALKSATEAQEKATVANDEAIAFAKLAAETKVQADQLATATANAAKPANRNVFVPSTAVTLKVTDAPITLSPTAPPAAFKQGMGVEVPVNITRLYGFNQAVNLSVIMPGGVGGYTIPNASIAAGQTASKIMVTAGPNATIGKHELTVRASLNLNGQQLTVDQPVTITVEQADAAN